MLPLLSVFTRIFSLLQTPAASFRYFPVSLFFLPSGSPSLHFLDTAFCPMPFGQDTVVPGDVFSHRSCPRQFILPLSAPSESPRAKPPSSTQPHCRLMRCSSSVSLTPPCSVSCRNSPAGKAISCAQNKSQHTVCGTLGIPFSCDVFP